MTDECSDGSILVSESLYKVPLCVKCLTHIMIFDTQISRFVCLRNKPLSCGLL